MYPYEVQGETRFMSYCGLFFVDKDTLSKIMAHQIISARSGAN